MKKVLAFLFTFIVMIVVADIFQPSAIKAASAVPQLVIQVVSSTGTVLNGVASAVSAVPRKTVQIVDSSDHIIDSFGGGTGVPGGITGNTQINVSSAFVGLPNAIHAYTGTLATALAACPGAAPCNIIADPGQTYTVSSPLIIGTSSAAPQTLIVNGATIQCTNTLGAGHGCIVVGNYGKVVGSNRINSSITAAGTANIDALVESYTAYEYSTLATQFQQVNMHVEGVSISAGAATIQKAAMWVSGIDGLGVFRDIYINPPSVTTKPAILVDDAPSGSAFTGMFWNALTFDNVWIGMGTETTGIDVECGVTSGSSGSNFTWTGGPIVDPTANNTTFMKINGANANCRSFKIAEPYLESSTGTGGTGILLNNTNSVNVNGVYCNAGSATNCVEITGVESGVHVDGYNTDSTNAVNDTNYGVVNTAQGQFVYDPSINGPNMVTASISASGATTVTLNPVMNKVTLTANSTLNLAKPAGGQDGFFATPTAPSVSRLEVCQDTPTGSHTLAWGHGSGVSAVCFNADGGACDGTTAQPGYTLNPGDADVYTITYNGTNAYVTETTSNIACF